MHRLISAAVVLVFLAVDASAAPPPAALVNDNLTAAGHLRQGVLNLQLELVETTWYPEQDGGPNLKVYAFAEKDGAPTIPGPLIRVPQGTEVRVHIHNALPTAMFVRGLHGAGTATPVAVAPEATADIHFTADVPGSFYYSARSMKQSISEVGALTILDDLPMGEGPFGIESQLEGALIVDPPGSVTNDRIFVITNWMAGIITPPFREVLAINGKSWPQTERLFAKVGETSNWRIINTSLSDHAMHLHGFFFQVKSSGDQDRDQIYTPDQTPQAVTQYMAPGTTATIAWTPERAGNWLFHCHMTAHMTMSDLPSPYVDPKSPEPAHAAHADEHNSGMGSLVLGITVAPGAQPVVAAKSDVKPRQLRLLVREKPATRFTLARMGYQIQEGDAKEPTDPPPFPGAPLVLTRGEPVEITVVNQLKEETAVHWHGMEIESYYDGVPGWSGDSVQTTPSIAPGGSFLVRMTPPRSGTFIYHSHWHDIGQLTSGLYGPLIVMEPGQKFDPATDKIFILGTESPNDFLAPLLLNGSTQPLPTALKLGTKYRLRLINIGTNNSDATFSLVADAGAPKWRLVGKDGWTVPATQATARPATQRVSVGETYDFEFTPEQAGELTLQVTQQFLQTRISEMITVR